MTKSSEEIRSTARQGSRDAAATAALSSPRPGRFRNWFLGSILLLAVILVYAPALNAGFIWDDDDYVNISSHLGGQRGLWEIWTTRVADISPLTKTTFWVEHLLWGLAPPPYHLVNVLMHGVCAILLWRVLLALRVPGAWLGAALWALHPVQVESVAWVSEMKNTQSGIFFLLTILFFVRWLRTDPSDHSDGIGRDYILTLIFAALAMASKSSTVILPGVLCLCAWLVERRWDGRNLMRVTPFLFMAVAAIALSMWTQGRYIAEAPGTAEWARSWPQRLATAGSEVWFYLGKLLWPHPLIAIYPPCPVDAGQVVSYLPLLAVIALLAVLWFKRASWGRPGFFAFAYFVGTLLPVLGLVDNPIFQYSMVFDHFQYLASMGPLALIGATLARATAFSAPSMRWFPRTAFAGLLAILGLLSWRRARVFESPPTLWADTLAKNPVAWPAYNNLGSISLSNGQWDEAIGQYQKALEINPNLALVLSNMGNVYMKKGQVDVAMTCYQNALDLNPRFSLARLNLGKALQQNGQLDEAIDQYRETHDLNPDSAEALTYMANALCQKGELDDAISEYVESLNINPDLAQTHNNLGLALARKGKLDDAVFQFQEAVRLSPDDATLKINLARALAMAQQTSQSK